MATQKTPNTSKTTKISGVPAKRHATGTSNPKNAYPVTRYKNPTIETAFNGRVEITPAGAGFQVKFIDDKGEQSEQMKTLTAALSYVEQCGFTLEEPADAPAKPAKAAKTPRAKSAETASPESVTAMMADATAALTGALDDDSTRVCEKHGAVYTASCPECDAEQVAQAERAHETFAEIEAIQALQAAHPDLDHEVELAVAELQSTPPVEVATPVATETPAKTTKVEPTVEAYQVAPSVREIEKVAAVIREALGKKYSRDFNALVKETPDAYTELRRHVAITGDIYGLVNLDAEIRAIAGELVKYLDFLCYGDSLSEVQAALVAYLERYRLENVINLVAETFITAQATGASAQTILEGYTLTLSTRTLADGSHYYERDYHRAR